MERGGSQGVQFIVHILLARLLLPEDYGLIALVSIFILMANIFVSGGFNIALIQKQDSDEIDFSSVFYVNLFVATILYIILFIIAPFIANFYGEAPLVPILRILSISLFFEVFNLIQNAYISKYMMFRKLFLSSLGSILISGTVGLIFAYMGYGVWALVIQQLVNQFMVVFILWFIIEWRPCLSFSPKRLGILFSYGWKLLISSLLDTLDMEIRTLVIGRIYSPMMLGYYNKGKQFPQVIVVNIDGSIQSVMLPALAAYQDNKMMVKNMVRRSIVTSSFIIMPMMFGLAIVAEPLVGILLTDKWLPSVPFLQIFCISYALIPIHQANLQAIKALGRSDIFLRIEIIKKIIAIIILVISVSFGVYAIAWGVLLSGVIEMFINMIPNLKLFDYGYREQLKEIMPSVFISLSMGVIIYSFKLLNLSTPILLVLQIISGVIIYFLLANIFQIESLYYLIVTLKDISNSKRGE